MLPQLPTDKIFPRKIKSNAKYHFLVLLIVSLNFINGKNIRNILSKFLILKKINRLNMCKNIMIKLQLSA